jgi:2',3'-cyclic-nucleotide 2'-phosphodiesterase (5'-nucleotidase family)
VYGDLEDVETLIKNTDGFDVVLDAHSHSVIEKKLITDEGGNEVVLSSTGTKFEFIGKLVISNGKFDTTLIKTADYQNTDTAVNAYLEEINSIYDVLGNRKVAHSEVDLITHDADGNRLVRKAETNLGNLCAEAMRSCVDADIGYVNGGGIRSSISAGDVKFNDLLAVFPFNNTVVLAEINGQTIKDMLEMSMMKWPGEDGCFPHLAGITFSLNKSIPSSVITNDLDEFQGVSGEYRVYDIKVFNRETQTYEPLVLDKKYTIAAANYYLLDCGSGMTMFKNVKILRNDGMLDVEALERYVSEDLNGIIGQEYANVTTHITFTD